VSIGAGDVGDLSAILGLPKRITPQTHPELVDFEVKSGDVVLMWRGGPVDLVKVERVESDKINGVNIVNGKRYNWRKSRYVQKLDASRYVQKLDASRYV
jgi:cystathionine beta-lyase family protein involved in aluminum resistance